MKRLKTALGLGGILPDDSINYVASHFRELRLKAEEDFSHYGKVANEIGFVDEGVLRIVSPTPKGEEITKYFVRHNQFITDLESYYSRQPSESAIRAVLPSRVYTIQDKVWNKLSEEVPKLYILTKTLTETALLNKIKDNDFLNFGTAMEKYREFLRRYPDLALSVPQQYIASYLKITPQSLSRIRKQLANQ